MTIAVDLVLATRPNASTGIERYAINLFEALRRIAPEAIAFVDSRAAVPTGPGVVRVPGGFRGWLTLPLSRAWREARVKSVVCPAFPPSPLLLATRKPVVRIIHDDFPWTRGEAMNLRGRALFRHAEAAMAPHYAQVLAPTALMADSLATILRRPVGVIGNAPGIDLALAPEPARTEPGVIAVGTVEPRKNYDAVLALADSLATHAAPWTVRVVGRQGWGDIAASWESQVAARAGRLEWHGHASDAALLALYQSATCFVSMSLAEGFNMPLVEAGSLGLPVVCSDIAIHRQVAPPWARFVPLTIAPADLARVVEEAAALPPAPEAVQAYRHRFSWDGIAQALVERLRQA
ncbi:glycosyltransferase [Novosphingobium pokkalii]|uniref:Glycosyltransferase n=1 Tax=Novosphingobium pokkalii TaxID=1770194 RepID=A0ABV7V5D9_9SPHN|nr:glycosyltransferase [Novosphingobium pokkalii]GHC91779.1 glycosyl transferase [Novosphingobium pokkalii]